MSNSNIRKSSYSVNDLIIQRWSSRALTSDGFTKEMLFSLFEAARWAPSSYNNQPWRFVYAMAHTQEWKAFFDLLVSANQVWAKNAGALVIVVSKNTFDYNGNFSRTHSFDTGAAWQNLALQATSMNIVAHAMEGFDYQKIRDVALIPEDYTVEAMIAIGCMGDSSLLPQELQEKEVLSGRKPLSKFVFESVFPNEVF